MDRITELIKAKTGQNIYDYTKQNLGVPYKSFRYRLDNNKLKLVEYLQIIKDTEMTFEELFGTIDKPIGLNEVVQESKKPVKTPKDSDSEIKEIEQSEDDKLLDIAENPNSSSSSEDQSEDIDDQLADFFEQTDLED